MLHVETVYFLGLGMLFLENRIRYWEAAEEQHHGIHRKMFMTLAHSVECKCKDRTSRHRTEWIMVYKGNPWKSQCLTGLIWGYPGYPYFRKPPYIGYHTRSNHPPTRGLVLEWSKYWGVRWAASSKAWLVRARGPATMSNFDGDENDILGIIFIVYRIYMGVICSISIVYSYIK